MAFGRCSDPLCDRNIFEPQETDISVGDGAFRRKKKLVERTVLESVSDGGVGMFLLCILFEGTGSSAAFTEAAGVGGSADPASVAGSYDDVIEHILSARSDCFPADGSGIPVCDRSVNLYGRFLLVESVEIYVRELGYVCAEQPGGGRIRFFSGSGYGVGMPDDRGGPEDRCGGDREKRGLSVKQRGRQAKTERDQNGVYCGNKKCEQKIRG